MNTNIIILLERVFKMKKYILLAIALIFASMQSYSQTNWSIDKSHTHLIFKVKHMVISNVSGYFKIFDGKLVTKGDNFENAYVELSADIASINTDNEMRDNHLKSADFFDAANFPKLTFKSKSFKKVSKDKFKVTGDMTMRGVTKTLTLDVDYNGTIKDPYGKTRAGFKISGKLDRFDYGLSWSKAIETGGLVVGKDVELDLEAEVVKD